MKQEKKKKKEKKRHNERIIKDRITRETRTPFEQQEQDYYEPKRGNNFWRNNYIEYERNGDKNRTLSIDEYLKVTKPYLRNIIIIFKILVQGKFN